MSISDANQQGAWAVSIIGFPILALIIFASFGQRISHEANLMSFVIMMAGPMLFLILGLTNWIFSFYTLVLTWTGLSKFEKLKYSAICVFTNVLSAYLMISLWKRNGVKVLTLNGSHKIFSVFLIFICFVVITIPAFVASRKFA